MQRSEYLQRLETETFDLCIVGGGASGAGCALDAALRGLKVALIEKTDFAAETSSRSTKLVHGGVRYLEQAFTNLDFSQLRQVRHGLSERHTLLRNAPHLAHPLGFITPVFSWWEGLYFFLGLQLYGWFSSGSDRLPKSRWLRKKEVLRTMPGISKKIHSGILYYDGQLDDARYCLALIQSAAAAGAVVVNYVAVTDFQKNSAGQITAATVNNTLPNTGLQQITVKATQFLNCCGPYADRIRWMANPLQQPRISPSKGVHLLLPWDFLGSQHGMLIPKTSDGRVVFAIPFEGKMLLGTTDEPHTDIILEPTLMAVEVDFLIQTLQPFLAKEIDKKDVKAGFAGLRPLVSASKAGSNSTQTTKTLLRDHEVEIDSVSGLISLLGGKWTTYRLMAQDAIDAVCWQLNVQASCTTATHTLAGAAGWEENLFKKIASTYGFDADVSQHLAGKYGVHAHALGEMVVRQPDLGQRIVPEYPYIRAEVVYAAQAEMAMTIRDFLARRVRLEFLDWKAAIDAAPEVGRLLGATLGWEASERDANTKAYVELIASFQNKLL
jgi:glycerol-3-phosphate dehydrogenase